MMHLLVSEYQQIDMKQAQQDNKSNGNISTITSYIKENYKSEATLKSGEDFGYSPNLSFRIDLFPNTRGKF